MELVLLKHILLKLKQEDVISALQSWSFLKSSEVSQLQVALDAEKKTKRSLATEIIEICEQSEQNLVLEHVLELELIYTQMFPTKKQWSAYHLGEIHGSTKKADISPVRLKSRLMKQIRNYFNKDCSVSLVLNCGLLWALLYLPSGPTKKFQSTRCLYFIYYPDSPVVIFSGMKKSFAEFVSQCLIVALGYKSLTDLSLSGHHYPSLAELALNKFSEGGFTKYQQTRQLHGPLNEVTSRKRKAKTFLEDSRILDRNKEQKRQRLETLEKTFGSNVMPTLEKVEYRVELPYRNKEIFPELKHDGELFNSRVRFQGSSVLEGIRNLAEASYAKVPLPDHLTCIPTRARNTLILAKPQRHSDKTHHANHTQVLSQQNKAR